MEDVEGVGGEGHQVERKPRVGEWRTVSGEGKEEMTEISKTQLFPQTNQSPDTKMAGSLVKAGIRGVIPPSPSTPGVHDAPAPQPPLPAQLLEGVGPAGEEGRGAVRENSLCSWDTCGLEGQGWEPGPAGEERERQPHMRGHAGPGEMGKSRDGGEGAVGAGRRSFLPTEEERGATARTETFTG